MNLARKTGLQDSLEDIITRLFLQSSPIIRAQIPKNRASPIKTVIKTSDDILVESFFEN